MTDTDLFIDETGALTDLMERLSEETVVSMDTEFVRERTYYPQLCLIQLAAPELTACVDCLQVDLELLFAYLLQPERTWLLHSARQDLEVIHQHTGRGPARLIDTQIAAGLLGYAPQIGLQDLVDEILSVKLDKGFARTNWAKRPLPEPAIHYALDDVRHLADLWQVLKSRLESRGRLDWLEEDCRTALSVPFVTPPATLWSRLKGIGSMERRAQHAALSLIEWRETCAQKLDRPRRWICDDGLLLRVARALPINQEELTSIAEMPRRLAGRFGAEILAAVADRDGSEKADLINQRRDQPRPDKNGLRQLQDRARLRAEELGIQPEVLATRKELGELLVGLPSERISNGWRSNQLQDLI